MVGVATVAAERGADSITAATLSIAAAAAAKLRWQVGLGCYQWVGGEYQYLPVR